MLALHFVHFLKSTLISRGKGAPAFKADDILGRTLEGHPLRKRLYRCSPKMGMQQTEDELYIHCGPNPKVLQSLLKWVQILSMFINLYMVFYLAGS